MSYDKLWGLLGMCARARQLVSGQEGVETAIRHGKTRLVLLCDTASENTKKAIADACAYRNVPVFILPEGRLGHAVGKPNRKMVCLSGGFAQKALEILSDEKVESTELCEPQKPIE